MKSVWVTHLYDPKRGRASTWRLWTLCGEQVMNRLVSVQPPSKPEHPEITCKVCLLASSLQRIGEMFGEGSLVFRQEVLAIVREALDRVRGEHHA